MNTHRIKGNGTVIALILAMAAPVQAGAVDRLPKRMLSASDRAAIFGVDSRFQVALLSEEEMAETKGALWWPFSTSWFGRLFWGGAYGAAYYGWKQRSSPYEHAEHGHPKLMGEFITLSAVAGLLSVHPSIAGAAQLASTLIYEQGGTRASVARLQAFMDRRGWTLLALMRNVCDATDRIAADRLQNGGDGRAVPRAVPYSLERTSESVAARSLDARRFLIGLIDTLDRASLRQFLSGIPTATLNYMLAKAAPESTTREDFLEDLPADVVNQVLLALSEEQMSRFLADVVPQYLRDAALPTSTAGHHLDVHWIY